MATELKVGDKVRKKDGRTFSDGSLTLTVSNVQGDGAVWFYETGTYLEGHKVEVVPPKSRSSLPPMQEQAKDPVHRPSHYARFEIEPIYFIMKNKLPFAAGNVVKYVCRWDAKDGIQDLKKARRYLDIMIKQAEGDEKFAE